MYLQQKVTEDEAIHRSEVLVSYVGSVLGWVVSAFAVVPFCGQCGERSVGVL